jgi:hypothetical protein
MSRPNLAAWSLHKAWPRLLLIGQLTRPRAAGETSAWMEVARAAAADSGLSAPTTLGTTWAVEPQLAHQRSSRTSRAKELDCKAIYCLDECLI